MVLLLSPSVLMALTAKDKAEAEAYLAQDLNTALAATLRHCPVLATETEGRLAAIVDFTFNLGAGRLQTSTLRRRVNQRDWAAVSMELRRWVYGGGRVLPGLVARREAECLILNGRLDL
ncbi:lysozyme [Ralstonia sp.]|uniref:lysozyme n=1 Tax=Ralstonia sp. TaxID=54061 RepID=UPI0025D783DD|nr:lysozyme [Ralstonia sp.]